MVERAYHLASGRAPTVQERDLSIQFLNEESLVEFTIAKIDGLRGDLVVCFETVESFVKCQ